MKSLIMVVALLSVPVPTLAQSSVGATTVLHGWYQEQDGRITWYQRGEKIGTLNLATREWQTAGKGEPVDLQRAFNQMDTHGVDASKLTSGYSKSGIECSREAAYDAVIRDDSHKKRITVVGDEATRRAALSVIGQPSWAVVKAYASDN